MEKIIIEGGKALEGTVKTSGSKNSALPILAATIVSGNKYQIEKCDSLSNLEKTNRRTHKILRKFGFNDLSVKIKPFYPFELTSKNNGYEIRCVIKFK